MGNNLINETETIQQPNLSNTTITEELCIWTFIKDGHVYNNYGSGRYEILNYAYVRKQKDPYISKMQGSKKSIGNIDPPSTTFTNVRKSTITRTYDTIDPKIDKDQIIGDYQSKSYNLTGVIE